MIRGQDPSDGELRTQFAEADSALRSHIAETVADGVEDGAFRDVDAERVAEFLVTSIEGAVNAARRRRDRYSRPVTFRTHEGPNGPSSPESNRTK